MHPEMTTAKQAALQRAALAYIQKHRAEEVLKYAETSLKDTELDLDKSCIPSGAYTATLNGDPTLVTINVERTNGAGEHTNGAGSPNNYSYIISNPVYT